jgi:hypothetical protein
MQQRDCKIAALRTELSRNSRMHESSSEALLGRVARLKDDVSALQTASALLLAIPPSGSVHSARPTPSEWNTVIVSV